MRAKAACGQDISSVHGTRGFSGLSKLAVELLVEKAAA
jgi:hypothetical protein